MAWAAVRAREPSQPSAAKAACGAGVILGWGGVWVRSLVVHAVPPCVSGWGMGWMDNTTAPPAPAHPQRVRRPGRRSPRAGWRSPGAAQRSLPGCLGNREYRGTAVSPESSNWEYSPNSTQKTTLSPTSGAAGPARRISSSRLAMAWLAGRSYRRITPSTQAPLQPQGQPVDRLAWRGGAHQVAQGGIVEQPGVVDEDPLWSNNPAGAGRLQRGGLDPQVARLSPHRPYLPGFDEAAAVGALGLGGREPNPLSSVGFFLECFPCPLSYSLLSMVISQFLEIPRSFPRSTVRRRI